MLPAPALSRQPVATRVAAPFPRWFPGHLPARAELSRQCALSPATAISQPDPR